MPILPHEPELFPEDLLERAETDDPSVYGWWVVHTKPRQEKTLARQLAALKIPHYVPQYERRTRGPSGRKRSSFAPLFAGYGFAYGTEDDRERLFGSTAIARLLDVPDQRQLTFDLRQIRRLTESGRILQPESVALMTHNTLPAALTPVSYPTLRDPSYGFGLGVAVKVDATDAAPNVPAGVYRWSGYLGTYFWVDPANDLVAMVWTQLSPGGRYPLQAVFQEHVYSALVR